MLFDFKAFINELRENAQKRSIIDRYEKEMGPIETDIRQTAIYIDYLSKFKTLSYKVPDELNRDFDWDLLLQLLVSSFSSSYHLEFNQSNSPELLITVHTGDVELTKTLSELWSFQILRLYEIYIEEHLNLEAHRHEDESEKEAIDQERLLRLELWNFCANHTEATRLVGAFCGER